MNDHKQNMEPWDQDSYETGSTRPPKNHGGIIALLLITVIILLGVSTVMGVLNIRLFAQTQGPTVPSVGDGMAFYPEAEATTGAATQPAVIPPENSGTRLELNKAPESVANVPQEGGLSLQEIYQKNIGAVVSISCTLTEGSASGTGVIFSDEGYIVTNSHVVEGARHITILLSDGREMPAALVGSDSVSDLAVLYIDAKHLTAAEFGDAKSLRVGDAVVAIGDPLGIEFRGTMTDGIVSAINREVSVSGRPMTLIQTNAALNSGNSGGPLINCYGQVIGINTMKIGGSISNSSVEGLGFAIPSTTVQDIASQLIRQGYLSGRPTLGISGEEVPVFYQYYYRLPAGMYITQVEPGSYAEYYGIEPGDILMAIEDTRITDMDSLNNFLYSHQVGDVVTAAIYRGGQQYNVELTLTENKK